MSQVTTQFITKAMAELNNNGLNPLTSLNDLKQITKQSLNDNRTTDFINVYKTMQEQTAGVQRLTDKMLDLITALIGDSDKLKDRIQQLEERVQIAEERLSGYQQEDIEA